MHMKVLWTIVNGDVSHELPMKDKNTMRSHIMLAQLVKSR